MSGMDPGALDRYITGNYGEDQYPEEQGACIILPGMSDAVAEDCTLHEHDEPEDDRDFDSMPGGWDYEDDEPDPDRFWDNRD